ncbi:MAG: STAS domain-containing protein [Candidatus Cloacimonetes bacterium]|nr:STAS domain-containing protein [Candidatus Cloacimonadota bacterium]
MDFRVDRRSNRIIVFCTGLLNAENAPEIEKQITPLLDDQSLPVILDFSGITYISSAGIRILIYLFKKALKMNRDNNNPAISNIRLVNLQPNVKRVLDLVELEKAFTEGMITDAKAESGSKISKSYQELLPRVREAFPAPVSDPERDVSFIQSIAKGLNCIDSMKTEKPYLGERVVLDYNKARTRKLSEEMSTVEESIAAVADYMQGIVIWGHPWLHENVIPPTTIPSIVGQLFSSIYNPNIIWDEYSHKVSQAEVEVAGMSASLIGYDQEKSAGVFTFGGTGTVLYGVKIGLEKSLPGTFKHGLREEPVIISSAAGHYAKVSVSGWLGIGTDNIVTVPTDSDNSMDLSSLESILRNLLNQGRKIACIIATMGTTDSFGIDNLEYISGLRDKLAEEYGLPYKPHIHADAVIGWAWAVFNDYDFETNPLQFSNRTLRSLWDTVVNIRTLHLADSIGLDFHKTGYGPYVSSLFICKNKQDLNLITRNLSEMPYMFQFGNYHPGVFTLETSRSGGAVLSALANFILLGKEGYRTILGHIVSMAEYLRSKLEETPCACLLNTYNYGPVTLFRLYPGELDANQAYHQEIRDPDLADQLEANNNYNRKIFNELHKQMEEGQGLALSITECYRNTDYGKPVLAIKSFVMSPFVDENAMDHLMDCIKLARKEV